MRVLLADDSKSTALSVVSCLGLQGYCVTHVTDGAAAVEAFQTDPPDLVLMDVVMPVMDGIEATRRIKALASARWVPVFILTARSDRDDIIAGFDAGADDYISKPIDFDVLGARIRSILRVASIQDRLQGILDNVNEAILSIDEAGRLTSYNRAAEVIFGYRADEVMGANIKMLMPAPYAEEHDGYLARYQREHVPHVIGIGRKVRGRRKNGETFPLELAVTESKRDNHSQFIGVVRDVSSEERAREEAEASAKAIAKSERFLRSITDSMPGLVGYWDNTLHCRFANKPYLEWFGKAPEAMDGITMVELVGERVFQLNEPFIKGVLSGERQQFERTLTKPDGSVGHTWVNYVPDVNALGEVLGFFVLVTDVTPIKEAQAELHAAANIFQNTTEGILVTDETGVIVSVNPAFSEITGYSAAYAIGKTPRILKSSHHDKDFHAQFWREITETGQWQGEIWNRRADGAIYLQWQTITRIPCVNAQGFRYVSVLHDVTDLWRKDEHLRHLAFHDVLTDLPNRLLLMDRLGRQIALAMRETRQLAVLFLDLDGFKQVNDTMGHEVGDQLLKEIAQRLTAQVRDADTIARLGGDEFVIVLNNPGGVESLTLIASRIIRLVREPIELTAGVVQVGVSIGIAIYPDGGHSVDALLKNADSAMYAAKQAGRNCFRLFCQP